ncbi:MAG: mechanosensitive ion channel domain-containing protein [Pseudomonadota bacterium]
MNEFLNSLGLGELDLGELGWLVDYALNVLGALVILIAGLMIAARLGRMVQRIGTRHAHLDETLFGFLGALTRWLATALTVIVVLGQFGVETTSLIALLGAAGLAIGLALQGTLSNLAAGVMILIFRPFNVGDFVSAGGHDGTVERVGLFTVDLVTPDNVLIIVPNSDVWAGAVTNFSAKSERRVDLVFGVSYATDLKLAEKVLREAIASDARILSNPAEPFIAVSNLGDSSVDFTMRVWCKAGDYWALKFALLRDVKERFDAAGVDIPFPTTTIVKSA